MLREAERTRSQGGLSGAVRRAVEGRGFVRERLKEAEGSAVG